MRSLRESRYVFDGKPGRNALPSAVGLAISLVVHIVLIFSFSESRSHHQPDRMDAPRLLVVQLFPTALLAQTYSTSTQISAMINGAVSSNDDKPMVRKYRSTKQRMVDPVAPTALENQSSATVSHSVSKVDGVLDIDKIRRNLGKIVKEMDVERNKLSVSQLDKHLTHELHGDTRLSREITAAGRSDCAKANGMRGGLLAPMYLLMEKKGTGCKF